MQVNDANEAFGLISHSMAEIRAEALASRIVCTILVQWVMQNTSDPKGLFDAVSLAIDKEVDAIRFLVTDGAGPEDGVLDERVREMTRNNCHAILQSAHFLR